METAISARTAQRGTTRRMTRGANLQESQGASLPRLLGTSRSGAMQQKNIPSKPRASAPVAPASGPVKGAISMLQEFVQCSQRFHIPSNYPVLQWDFDSQMADSATLEFRAVVAFLLDGVPHHVAGSWQPKKKDAQRDAAERALGLFVNKWSKHAPLKAEQGHLASEQIVGVSDDALDAEVQVEECCRTLEFCGGIPPTWSVCWKEDGCVATLELTLLGVPHKLVGSPASSEAEARRNLAERTLWYLQWPGYRDIYEPDPLAPAIVTMKIPAPPANWAHDPALDGALEVAQRKTAIMRVQNRLQQMFSRQLKPGLSVWEWTYEADPNDSDAWPPLYRASVKIPVIGKTFTGDWARGQRDAQLDAIKQVTHVLDQLEFKA